MSISRALQKRIRLHASNRCGYCRAAQRRVLGPLEIEHICPLALGGTDDEFNLWLACRLCNLYKAIQTHAYDPQTSKRCLLFNPRKQKWSRHFAWSEDGERVLRLTPCGRATVIALRLNNIIAVTVRREWIGAGWHPPQGDE